MPDPEWPVIGVSFMRLPLRHIRSLCRTPRRYLASLLEALGERATLHFILAVHFAYEMRESDIDVVYCFEGKHALWVSYFAARWHPLPIVVGVHSEMLNERTRIALTQRAARVCSKITTISSYNKKKLMERYDLPDEKIEVVRLWSPYRPDKRIKIMTVGAWIYRKGHEVILDALASLDPERYVLWIVGEGARSGQFYDVAAEVKRRGIEDRVIFWGQLPQEKLKVLYQACDIFTLPSRTTKEGHKEGIPVSLMEAMSFGRPVVSTCHAGIPELVEEILVEENNADQLREAFVTLGRDPELRRRLGERNRQIIQERYSERNVDRIMQVLASANTDSQQN